MELQAVIESMRELPSRSLVYLVTDSRYVVCVIRKIHRKLRRGKQMKAANLDLCSELYDVLKGHCVRVRWVRGHDTDDGNIKVDQLAEHARKSTMGV